MSSFSFAPQQYPQRETQKNYVFVDEHNRHKRLKVMRACEGCRRRKIKCDAATTNTWPCSACIRLKLQCVKPNGFDGASDNTFDSSIPQADPYGASMHGMVGYDDPKMNQMVYPHQYSDPSAAAAYQGMPYDAQPQPHHMNYASVQQPYSVMDPQQYAAQGVFPTPPLQQNQLQEPSPEAYSPESFQQQQDLSELLGNLKVDEKGTAPYLRNKASFRREEEPAVEDDDDFQAMIPPPTAGPGSKIRIPPPLMPEESDALNWIEAFFSNVHPYVPVLDKAMFLHQWHTNRDSISPLILEAIFSMGGRLRDDPSDGQQWLALATRHADSFMDIPRLSTLQGLLLLLKAREVVPKRGYYYRSWMTVVQCVQMGIDLGLDEHYEDHQAGRGCDSNPDECRLRTRIWQTVFVCEVMVGAPQGRHDLSVPIDSVDFTLPRAIPGGNDSEYHVTRNFTYFARVVRNVRHMSKVYTRIKKKKDWGIDPELKELSKGFDAWLAELPSDMRIDFPADGSIPWIQSPYLGNLHSYFYLTVILYHRPPLQFIDPNTHSEDWKYHMHIAYDAAKKLCKLQEAVLATSGVEGWQCMQRGYSFTVYAGLSCILVHILAIVHPEPEINTNAKENFTRHMRIIEKVMEVWSMSEVRQQVEAVREAFSADVRKPFVLKPSFPYGSPHPSNSSSPPRVQGFRPPTERAAPLDQRLDPQSSQSVSFPGYPISPPVSAGATDSNGDSPAGQPISAMSQAGQVPGMQQGMSLGEQPTWNPARIFEQWQTSFGTPASSDPPSVPQARQLNLQPTDPPAVASLPEYPGTNEMQPGSQQISPQQYSAAAIPNFVTPAMWQESVARVYEGGIKRQWDYNEQTGQGMRRR